MSHHRTPVSPIRRAAGALLGAAATATAALTLAAPSASALSCAAPAMTPESIVGVDAPAFFGQYEAAVIGTVTHQVSDLREGSPTYGETQTTVTVLAAFGEATGPSTVVVSGDPGWMTGYFYEEGSTYFIPLDREADGEFHSFLCDPIHPVDADTTDVDALVATAATNGVAAFVGGGPLADPDEGAPPPDGLSPDGPQPEDPSPGDPSPDEGLPPEAPSPDGPGPDETDGDVAAGPVSDDDSSGALAAAAVAAGVLVLAAAAGVVVARRTGRTAVASGE